MRRLSADQRFERDTHVAACEETTPERRIRDDRDAKLACSLQQTDLLIFNVGRKGRELDLERSDGMHSMSAAEGRGGDLGETNILRLSFPEKGSASVCEGRK